MAQLVKLSRIVLAGGAIRVLGLVTASQWVTGRRTTVMSTFTVYADVIFIDFIAGTLVGIFLIVCWASNREDTMKSIKGPPPGNGCGGARRLTGVGRRGPTSGRLSDNTGRQYRSGRGQVR
jgi:hypothetical protein